VPNNHYSDFSKYGKGALYQCGHKKNRAFSVNIPPESLVVETDYVGIVSGKKTDKSNVFEIF